MIFIVIITILALATLLFDVGHFVSMCVIVSIARVFQRKCKITETTVQYGICTPRDADMICMHMNNSKYLREADFARTQFFDRAGVFARIPWYKILVGASIVRYRKPIDILFSLYKIETKILCWDYDTIFLEHKFITLKDDFVRAIVLSRNHIVDLDVDLAAVMGDIPAADTIKAFPDEVVQFQRCLVTVSAKLRC